MFLICTGICSSVFCIAQAWLYAQNTLTDEQILKIYEGLRVADVCDGMDMVGLRDAGTMDATIEPLWRDTENFKHRFCGIAVTARYVPTNRVVKNPMAQGRIPAMGRGAGIHGFHMSLLFLS